MKLIEYAEVYLENTLQLISDFFDYHQTLVEPKCTETADLNSLIEMVALYI